MSLFMLEQKDFERLKNMMESVMKGTEESILEKVDGKLEKTEKSILEKVDEKLEKTEESILEKVDKKIVKSESLVLDEIERTRSSLEKHIEKVEKNLDELNQYYQITKLESDNTALLLKLIDDLSKRVEKLEKRTA